MTFQGEGAGRNGRMFHLPDVGYAQPAVHRVSAGAEMLNLSHA